MRDFNTQESQSRVTIVIPTYNASSILNECLSNLKEKKWSRSNVLIVDDCSTDHTERLVRQQFPEFQYTRTDRTLGFAGACNHGLDKVTTPFVAFLNNDAFPEKGWDEEMVKTLECEGDVAIASSKIYRKGTQIIDSAGGLIEFPLGRAPARGYLESDVGLYDNPADVAYVSGAAMIARTKLLKELGGFDQDYRNYAEEMDLAWRLRLLGYKIRYRPSPTVDHIGSFTMGMNPDRKTFFIMRNIFLTNLKNLETRNIPRWLLHESVYAMLQPPGTIFFSGSRSYAAAYFRGLLSFAWHVPSTLRKRVKIQAHRKLPDSEVLRVHRSVSLATEVRRYLGLTIAES